MSQPETVEPIVEKEIEAVVSDEQSPIAGAEQAQEGEVMQEQEQARDPMAELEAEVAKWKDLALRNAAELDNYRKRSAREMQESRAYGNADLLRSLLPIMDNFEMGLEAARVENEKSMIFLGLNMVKRQLADFLKEQAVEDVSPEVGGVFDPNMHEAVSQEASEEVADGGVLRVLRRGFKLKERLLRPANVVVSSGPAKAE
ncbi:nucleotide exchange factor GrpE [Phragmitibacter flavus]|uniref:Protein GrpE n=1 Tax=Phragmitibacter flavus TaxID=2576071 RepID=A0A5R8KBC3_9BACT|nr:nucleotide exchange factor GrpE [Phragmitibacter flavus]TLD69557.1 nucleotide exchange factor GrpE [Phragmitibacter flavus]